MDTKFVEVPVSEVRAVERALPVLPTETGSVIRASAAEDHGHSVTREVMFLDANGHWHDLTGYRWLPNEIDLSTVEIGRIVFDGEVSE
jgi:hypothetical protein